MARSRVFLTGLLGMAPTWPERSKRRQKDSFCQGEERKYLVIWLQREKTITVGEMKCYSRVTLRRNVCY